MKTHKKLYFFISLLIVTCMVLGRTVIYADLKEEVNYNDINGWIKNNIDRIAIAGYRKENSKYHSMKWSNF